MAGKRYAALLRGVYPNNPALSDLRRSFVAAGFEDVSTVLSSGNVVFTAPKAANATLERKAERVMAQRLHRPLVSIVRSIEELRAMLESDPYARFELPAGSKRVVTFLKDQGPTKLRLPMTERDGTRILAARDGAVFTAYVPGPKGGLFMKVIEGAWGRRSPPARGTR